jgi:hypothetical protein
MPIILILTLILILILIIIIIIIITDDDDEGVKTAVMEHFSDKETEYFLKGKKLLVHRCEKCVEIKGDYIEK